ncbi:SDR family oxidoreductase [Nocardia sp. ET3-3]|uniref:SDR family oxidoreductase n=1 Tax=Nocardia terrae TaxID=2675851 RepID=A0A7K1V4A2_9NOCA|nr:SDR family oxidoreductase [Nocardia terrae]
MNHLIIGGSSALGRVVVKQLSARGDAIVATSRMPEPDQVLCDVTSENQVADAIATATARLGSLDSVIYLPGFSADGSSTSLATELMVTSLEINTIGAFRVAREALRAAGTHPCALTFVGTTNALRGVAGQAAYTAGKAALLGLARSLAGEFGPRGHRINVVAPGYIDGGLTVGLTPRNREQIERIIPLRRFADMEEIANVIAFVASSKSTYLNGAVIYADGGLAMGH